MTLATSRLLFAVACVAAALPGSLQAALISLTPATINGGDTNTASFSDGSITLTPFVHDGTGFVQNTFNALPARLGIDNNGTNNNAFADADTTVGNAGDEALEFTFAPMAGLSGIDYDFSRADGTGTNDGVIISGFISDPGVTFSISNANLFAVYDGAGTVRINIPGTLFGGTLTSINFTNLPASLGQTLFMTVHDTDQAGAQLAIRGISYTTIPEPSALALAWLAAAPLVRRRKR